MDYVGSLATLAGVLALGVISPGPNFVIVSSTAMQASRRAGLADVLGRIASHPGQRLGELLLWNWKPTSAAPASLDAAA